MPEATAFFYSLFEKCGLAPKQTLALFLAESGPTLLRWLMILSFPVWLLWRRYQRSVVMS